MKFDWPEFLDKHRIPYTTRGPNTPRGDISVKCPFCGDADQSDHMAISLRGDGWHCWRDQRHKGKHPARLIQVLIKCTMQEAIRLAGTDKAAPADFHAQVQANLAAQGTVDENLRGIALPKEFKPFRDIWSAKPFLKYLDGRGMLPTKPEDLTLVYGLHYCTSDTFKGRIIFPVHHRTKLVSWTGRTIYPSVKTRYKALTTDADTALKQGVPTAVAPINHHLLWFDELMRCGAPILVLVEGPLDALKVNMLGRPTVRATCMFTSMPTEQQVKLFRVLFPKFKRRFLIPDRDANDKALYTVLRLSTLSLDVAMLPQHVADPAELSTTSQLMQILG